MKQNKGSLKLLGVALYVIGIIIGMVIAITNFLPDFEAQQYGFTELTSDSFNTLRCPSYLGINHVGIIRASFSNPLDRPIEPIIRIDISSPTLIDSRRQKINIQPGEKQSVEFQVSSANIDLGHFIFLKVFRYPTYPIPLQEATCGIWVYNIPGISGSQLLIAGLVSSVILVVLGIFLWVRASYPIQGRQQNQLNYLVFLALLLAITIIISLLGMWLIGMILLVVNILMIVVVLAFLTQAT
jgi:hypothetical protein